MIMMADSDHDPRRKKDIKKEEDELNALANYSGKLGDFVMEFHTLHTPLIWALVGSLIMFTKIHLFEERY